MGTHETGDWRARRLVEKNETEGFAKVSSVDDDYTVRRRAKDKKKTKCGESPAGPASFLSCFGGKYGVSGHTGKGRWSDALGERECWRIL